MRTGAFDKVRELGKGFDYYTRVKYFRIPSHGEAFAFAVVEKEKKHVLVLNSLVGESDYCRGQLVTYRMNLSNELAGALTDLWKNITINVRYHEEREGYIPPMDGIQHYILAYVKPFGNMAARLEPNYCSSSAGGRFLVLVDDLVRMAKGTPRKDIDDTVLGGRARDLSVELAIRGQ
jgi:hypothetical protein